MVGSTTSKTVTIEKRGTFHDDAFFKDSWDSWDQAMQDVVKKWDQEAPLSVTHTTVPQNEGNETRSIYRKIRSSNVTSDESQAVSCTEEPDKFKVVIDVRDFKPEGINVKTVDDTVIVEGKVEKKEGNSISTQTFIRRFLLPSGINLNAISSALSRDGVLTINAPKLNTKPALANGRTVPLHREVVSSSKKSFGSLPAAGKPSTKDTDYINRSATNTTHLMRENSPKRNLSSMPAAGKPTYSTTATVGSPGVSSTTVTVPEKVTSESLMTTDMSSMAKNHWNSFNDMVEKSQKEMNDMMKRHTLDTTLEPAISMPKPPAYHTSLNTNNSSIAVPSNGVSTTRDVTRDGNKITEREEHRWEDQLAPGLNRTNRAKTEISTIKNASGDVVGLCDKKQQHSHAEGSNEQILPDGSKVKTFTKNYETKNFYAVNSNGAKAL